MSGISAHLLSLCGLCNQLEQERDPRGQLVGGALERGKAALASSRLTIGVRDAPMDQSGRVREIGADLADAIAEADHVVESLGRELVEVLGLPPAEIDAARAHHAHGVGMKRL